MLETVDLVIRAACIGICSLLAIHFGTIRPVSRKTISALSLVGAAAGFVIATSTLSIEIVQISQIWSFSAKAIVAVGTPLIAWGLLELFEDDFEIQNWQLAFVAFSVSSHLFMNFHLAFAVICHLSTMMIYGYVFYMVFKTHSQDLVQARCMFRVWFMSSAATTGIVFSALHAIYGDLGMPQGIIIFKASVMFILGLIFAYWALAVREQVWALPNRDLNPVSGTLSPAETGLLAKLKTSMQGDIWKQEGLTIRKLAEELDAPEHRLRKVINQGLGYRNFAHFVNEHRIGAACEVLADPVRADVPIITIAYDVGYASLGPFNRAFRDIVGESPTEYRKRSVVHA